MIEEIKLSENDINEMLQTINSGLYTKFVTNGTSYSLDPMEYTEIEIDGYKVNLLQFLQFDIFLDSLCNANCPFCINKAKNTQIKDSIKKDILSYPDFIKRFDNVYKQMESQLIHKPFIMLTGGEPTISPRFIPFIQHLLKRKIRYNLLTNGSNLVKNIDGKLLIDIMAPNCNGMQISRAHYDDNKNRELMNLNVKVTNENLKKAIEIMHEKFLQPYHVGFSCMMMKTGIHTLEDIKNYIEHYKDLNLSIIVFREMENISEYTEDIENVNKIYFKFEDIKNDLLNDKDFVLTDTFNQNNYVNYYFKYKNYDLPISFSCPGPMKERLIPDGKINGLTMNPNGRLYYNYFYDLKIK